MKIVTASNGKKTVKMSKVEWQSIGKKAGWISKKADSATEVTEKTWMSPSGHKCEVVVMAPRGFRCGYVYVSENNSLFGKSANESVPNQQEEKIDSDDSDDSDDYSGYSGYDSPNRIGSKLDVHGGISVTGKKGGLWVFGYDCDHYGDDPQEQTLEFCIQECNKLSSQLKEYEI